jgi:hypothetical protein
MIGVVYFSLIFGENGLDNGVHYTLMQPFLIVKFKIAF